MSSERGLNGGSAFNGGHLGVPYLDVPISTDAGINSSPFVMNATINRGSRSRSATPDPALSAIKTTICQVCGDDSPGIRKHYGAISCEACKCFFRRSVQMSKRYTCNYNGKCPIGQDKRIRHWCQKCRFQKCLEVGMKIDAVKLHRQSVTGGSRSSSPVRTPKSGSPKGLSSSTNAAVSGVTAFSFQGMHSQSQHLLPPGLTPDMMIKPEDMEAFTEYVSQPDMLSVNRQHSITPQQSPMHTPHHSPHHTPHHTPYGTPVPSPSPAHSPGQHSPMPSPGSPGSTQMTSIEGPLPFTSVSGLPFFQDRPQTMTHQSPMAYDPTQARTEEVLDSFKQRIIFLFHWAKSVEGFEILFPLDQKALLRSSVVQIVMLGLALRSQKLDGALQLPTGKLLKPEHENAGVAAVTAITLNKLSRAVRQLNVDDREWALLKEILLFNPEATGVGNTEVVREQRRKRHIALLEHTLVKDEMGRFGELLLLLPPLGELSAEVIEQLRLEQVVSEGEVRIDASLLMSVMNGDDPYFQGHGDISWPPPMKHDEQSPFQ